MTAPLSPRLAHALSLASTPAPAPKPVYVATPVRRITRRGIVWLGQTCNLRCRFCYFLDRIENPDHPEHPFMRLEKAKTICSTLVEHYGNNSIDIQGGEPTLWPDIFDLVRHCADIGLEATIITNAQVLSNARTVARYREAGLRDFLISVQGLGDVYDDLVRRKGAHDRQMRALRNLQEEGIPFRFNTVLSKPVLAQLGDVAELAIRTGAEVVNFLGFNPFNDQETGKRTAETVPTYSELAAPLDQALDRLEAAGVEANVRYLPLCVVAERHRPSVYDFPQIPYDLHENDFASWSWTDLPAQRTRDGDLTPPHDLGPRLRLGPLRGPLRRMATRFPALADRLHGVKQRLELAWSRRDRDTPIEERYRRDAQTRAREYTGYRHVERCTSCDARAVCDGFHRDYVDFFGPEEARPIETGAPIRDPQHFTHRQRKRVHPSDRAWLER